MLHDTVGGQFIEVAEEVQMCQPTPRFGSNSPFCLLGQPHCYVHKFYTLFKVHCTVVVVVGECSRSLPDCGSGEATSIPGPGLGAPCLKGFLYFGVICVLWIVRLLDFALIRLNLKFDSM